jgi:hypothetical protein
LDNHVAPKWLGQLSLEEITEHTDHKVLMEVGETSVLTVGNLQRILGRQLRPRPNHLINNNIIFVQLDLSSDGTFFGRLKNSLMA